MCILAFSSISSLISTLKDETARMHIVYPCLFILQLTSHTSPYKPYTSHLTLHTSHLTLHTSVSHLMSAASQQETSASQGEASASQQEI